MPKAAPKPQSVANPSTTANGETKAGKGATPKPSQVKHPQREILYDKVTVKLCAGDKAITVDYAKKLLGWEEETDQVKFGADYMLVDKNDKKIRCLNNMENRPITMENVKKLAQEHLRKRWRLNGEPLVIGKTGQTINAQHRLVSLIIAEQMRTGVQAEYWKQFHDKPLTMDSIVVFGIEEDDDTVNTIDTGKPRTLDEVIYRCGYFNTMKANDRKVISGMLSHAVKLLWDRTGAGLDAYSPNRTHAEAIAFIDRHPRLIDSVKHIFEENKDGSITKVLKFPAGNASGLLYLMASSSSKTDSEGYRTAKWGGAEVGEHFLDFSLWDKACTFWVELVKGAKEVKCVRDAMGDFVNGGKVPEKRALMMKAWIAYIGFGKITPSQVKVVYGRDAKNDLVLSSIGGSHPDSIKLGGIDFGSSKTLQSEIAESEDPDAPTPEEIEEETNGIHAAKNKGEVEDELDLATKGELATPAKPLSATPKKPSPASKALGNGKPQGTKPMAAKPTPASTGKPKPAPTQVASQKPKPVAAK